ncbi:hypothetical protein llap_22774 [Limosa lapponica baueri]|uniref:Fatty acid desaturase domain-containing protein n=1 Tax=Limosa lapponica baueri TaxID=1758121 RepID=A0A2I0SZH6_LIMLA|nr:hypothetical protein llap_22774 [Limosa lapponica baueri]
MGWFQHDLGHCSVFRKPKWNRLLQIIVINVLKGLPASWWNHLHNQHHAKPNCFRKDPDLNMHPLLFSLGKTLSVEVSEGMAGKAKISKTESCRVRCNHNPGCAFLHKLLIISKVFQGWQLVIMMLRHQLLRSKVLKSGLKFAELLEEQGEHLEGRPRNESVHLQ